MWKYFIILFLMIIAYLLYSKKIKIIWKTFFHRGFKPNKNIYGIYCYCGKQGSSKTLNVIQYLYENRDKIIYSNLKSINSDVIPYTYIKDLDDLLKLRSEHDIIIFFDEIFTEINKHQRISTEVMDFLSQMRKRRIILLTTCQEWRLLPLDFRLYVRYQINCSLVSIPFFKGITIKNIIDGDDIKWSDEEQDFVGNLISNTISHTQLRIANLYDTYEQIGKFSNYSSDIASTPTSVDSEEEEKSSEANFDMGFWDTIRKDEDIYEQEEEQRAS